MPSASQRRRIARLEALSTPNDESNQLNDWIRSLNLSELGEVQAHLEQCIAAENNDEESDTAAQDAKQKAIAWSRAHGFDLEDIFH